MSVESPALPARLPHLPRVQLLRGVAALLVLLAHLAVVEGKYSPDRLLGDWAAFGFAGVDLFFVISGFIMVYVTWGGRGGARESGRFLWRRATRIYPLYWAVSAAVLVVWLLRPAMVFGSNPDPDILRSFLLLPDEHLPLLSVGWTLIYEMYFYLVFALALLLPARWRILALVAWAVVAQAVPAPEGSPTLAVMLSPLVREFLFGALVAWTALTLFVLDPVLGGRAPVLAGRRWGVVAAAALLGLGLWSLFGGGVPDAVAVARDHGWRAEAWGLPAAALLVLTLLSPFGRLPLGDWLGDISYSLYLTHVLTLSLLGRLWAPWARDGVWDNAVMLAVLVAGSVAVAAAAYYAVERPLIRWFRRRRAPRVPSGASEPASR